MSGREPGALERLEALRATARAAKLREGSLAAERAGAHREATAAKGARAAYYAAVESGDREPDPAVERSLRDGLVEAEAYASTTVWEAKAQGTAEARDRADLALEEFGRSRFDDLAAELAAPAPGIRDRLQEAHAALEQAEGEYVALLRRWHVVAPYGDLPAGDVPANPLVADPAEVGARFDEGIPLPVPRSLLEEPVA